MESTSRLDPELGCLIVTGGPKAGKKYVAELLSEGSTSLQSIQGEESQILYASMALDTKYYSAQANVLIGDVESLKSASTLKALRCLAVILVFCHDSTEEDVSVALGKAEALLEEPWISASCDVRLCVVNRFPRNSNTHDSPAYSYGTRWALEHGFEMVRCCIDEKRGNRVQPPLADSVDSHEIENFERAINALETMMWPGMEMKDINAVEKNCLVPSTSDHVVNPDQTIEKEEDMEAMLSKFEKLLANAAEIRELGASGAITDVERRIRASDAALELWNLVFDEETDLYSDEEL